MNIFFRMKRFILFIMFYMLCNVFAFAQEQSITVKLQNATLKELFSAIEKQSTYRFSYRNAVIDSRKDISLSFSSVPVSTVLKAALEHRDLDYSVISPQSVVITDKVKRQTAKTDSVKGRSITGIITDEQNRPLPGATVMLKGTQEGVVSDPNGKYTIANIPYNGVLQYSFVGMQTQDVVADGSTSINIKLKSEISKLEEVVVVGYGTQKKINLTGSVVSLDTKNIEKRAVANVSSILSGQPGVTVIQNGGAPGRDQGSLYIRGVGTTGTASPLVIIDGVPGGDLNSLNPNDIENISILKDASSTAIYGINGAFGVILVTTKRGTKQKLQVRYKFQMGASDFIRLPQKVNSSDLAILYNEGLTNDGQPVRFTASDIEKFRNGGTEGYANTDWVRRVFSKAGAWMQHDLALSGGTEDTQYNTTLGYLNQDGIMENTGYRRFNFRTRVDHKVSKKLNVGFNSSLAVKNITDPPTNQGVGGESWYLNQVFRMWANDPVSYKDGRWAYPYWGQQNYNPVAYISKDAGKYQENNNNVSLQGYAEYEFTKGLKLKGIVSNLFNWDYSSNWGLGADLYRIDPTTGVISSTPDNTASMPAVASKRNISKSFIKSSDLDIQALLTYEKTAGSHDIKLLAGAESRSLDYESNGISRINLTDPSLTGINAADPTGQTTYGSKSEYRAMSAFGRLNYILKERYLIEANIRTDATSKFEKSLRYRTFPSFSLGWIISKESFFKVPVISNLKVRASWGKSGNENSIGNYAYLQTYSISNFYIFNGTRYSGITEGALANPLATWENTTSINGGFDLSLFDNRLTLSADYYTRETKGILLTLPVPSVLGATPPYQNAEGVRNRGWEVTAAFRDKAGSLNYYVNASLSYNKNEITDLKGTDTPGLSVGDPIGNIYGYVSDGIFQNTNQINSHADQSSLGGTPKVGDLAYKNISGNDNVIDANDRRNIGKTIPSYNYGFNMGAEYKGIDISMVWQGVADVQGMLAGRLQQSFWQGSSPIKDQMDRWTPDNTSARFPRTSLSASYNYLPSSWWIVNASYLKLRNIQIGYNIPDALVKRIGISGLRIYLTGENLLTFSPSKIIDPESLGTSDPFYAFSGTTAYPTTKRYLLGVNLTF